MDIVPLANCPHHLPTLARWHHAEWSELRGGQSLEACRRGLQEALDGDGLPVVVVAIEHGEVVGSAALVDQAMTTHPEWTPWLAAVYVAPRSRGRGVGSRLVERIIDETDKRNFDELYLFTTTAASLYRRFGWTVVATETYNGFDVTVMRLQL